MTSVFSGIFELSLFQSNISSASISDGLKLSLFKQSDHTIVEWLQRIPALF